MAFSNLCSFSEWQENVGRESFLQVIVFAFTCKQLPFLAAGCKGEKCLKKRSNSEYVSLEKLVCKKCC